jgi:ubiquinone/menaquinone biosynthesis C-methylase UbiE
MVDEKENPSFVNSVLSKLDHTPRTILGLNPSQQTIELAKRLPQSLVLGMFSLHSSADLISVYKDRLKNENIGNVNFSQGSQDDLPYEDGTFDMVIFEKKFTGFIGFKKILEEIYRVLSINGQAFLSILLKDSQIKKVSEDCFEIDKMAALINELLFKNGVRIERKELNLEIVFKRIN